MLQLHRPSSFTESFPRTSSGTLKGAILIWCRSSYPFKTLAGFIDVCRLYYFQVHTVGLESSQWQRDCRSMVYGPGGKQAHPVAESRSELVGKVKVAWTGELELELQHRYSTCITRFSSHRARCARLYACVSMPRAIAKVFAGHGQVSLL